MKARVEVEFSSCVFCVNRRLNTLLKWLQSICAEDVRLLVMVSEGVSSLAEGVDTRWRKFPYPFCAEDVRTLRSGVVCAPKVRLKGVKAIVYRTPLCWGSESVGRGVL